MSLITQHMPLVLASGSAIRAQMLKAVGLQFSVVPSGFDETALKQTMHDVSPAEQALRLSQEKCLSVSKDYPDHITIGADQICELEGAVLDKPGTKENAVKQLRSMNGKPHHQHSAVCIAQGERVLWNVVQTATLNMLHLDESELVSYVQVDQPLHSCGSYRLEGMGRYLFSSIDGDYDVVKGLPLLSLLCELKKQKLLSIN